MNRDEPAISRWEAIKQYGIGYGIITGLSMVIAFIVGSPSSFDYADVIASILGGTIGILLIPGLFAWLGKRSSPGRRFALFLALWIIVVFMLIIDTFS